MDSTLHCQLIQIRIENRKHSFWCHGSHFKDNRDACVKKQLLEVDQTKVVSSKSLKTAEVISALPIIPIFQ